MNITISGKRSKRMYEVRPGSKFRLVMNKPNSDDSTQFIIQKSTIRELFSVDPVPFFNLGTEFCTPFSQRFVCAITSSLLRDDHQGNISDVKRGKSRYKQGKR